MKGGDWDGRIWNGFFWEFSCCVVIFGLWVGVFGVICIYLGVRGKNFDILGRVGVLVFYFKLFRIVFKF